MCKYAKYHLLFWAPLPTQLVPQSRCYLTWKLHCLNLKQSTKWLFSWGDWDKKKKLALSGKSGTQTRTLLCTKRSNQGAGCSTRLAKGQDEAYSIFHWSCVIRSVTYPINHFFMVTDAGQLCKTFWTALVGWDSQAFTLGKHPEKHFKRCISIPEIAFKNENTLQRNFYQEQWDIIRYQNYWPLQTVLF